MSLKCRYLCTHIIKMGENIKMTTRDNMDYNEEEEQMVARVGRRGRSLVQVLIRGRGESRQGPSKFASDPGHWNEIVDTGGWSTWSGSGKEIGRTSGKREKKSDH